jgi:hypothetical protein
MAFASKYQPRNAVSQTGAKTGCILCGASPTNTGLRLRILHDQPRGQSGPIQGSFQILDVGDNKHSELLEGLLGRATDAEEVVHLIRTEHPGCVSIVNANILVLEEGSASSARAVPRSPKV